MSHADLRLIPGIHSLVSNIQQADTIGLTLADDPANLDWLLQYMGSPLAAAFLVYHTYLIWAGMTTNESSKWSDWKEEVADGMAYKSSKAEIYSSSPLLAEYQSAQSFWPVSSDQVLILTDGEPPKEGCLLSQHSNEITQPSNKDAPIDRRWIQVQSMKEIDNIYDLGFWDNLRHVLGLPIRPKVI
ncbi:copper transport protein [Aspergillus niger]|nr:copper transport protein [Aspergillus niger]